MFRDHMFTDPLCFLFPFTIPPTQSLVVFFLPLCIIFFNQSCHFLTVSFYFNIFCASNLLITAVLFCWLLALPFPFVFVFFALILLCNICSLTSLPPPAGFHILSFLLSLHICQFFDMTASFYSIYRMMLLS